MGETLCLLLAMAVVSGLIGAILGNATSADDEQQATAAAK